MKFFLLSLFLSSSLFAQVPIPEIMELRKNDQFPVQVLEQFNTEDVASSLVQWIKVKREKEKRGKTPIYDFRKQSRIVIAFNLRNLESIQQNCFLNQHQTGTSNAYLGGGRIIRESKMMGLKLGNTTAQEKELLPKYAYLFPDGAPGTMEKGGGILADYGGLYAQFKHSVKDRATFTAGDSIIIAADTKGLMTFDYKLYSEDQIDKWYGSYWEAQIWGKVCMDEVEHFLVGCTAKFPEAEIERVKRVTGKPVYKCEKKMDGVRVYSVDKGERL